MGRAGTTANARVPSADGHHRGPDRATTAHAARRRTAHDHESDQRRRLADASRRALVGYDAINATLDADQTIVDGNRIIQVTVQYADWAGQLLHVQARHGWSCAAKDKHDHDHHDDEARALTSLSSSSDRTTRDDDNDGSKGARPPSRFVRCRSTRCSKGELELSTRGSTFLGGSTASTKGGSTACLHSI